MTVDLSPALTRARDLVNGLLLAIASLVVGLLVFVAPRRAADVVASSIAADATSEKPAPR